MTILEALKTGKPVMHEGWYDGRPQPWSDENGYLMLNKKLLVSKDWQVHDPNKKTKSKNNKK